MAVPVGLAARGLVFGRRGRALDAFELLLTRLNKRGGGVEEGCFSILVWSRKLSLFWFQFQCRNLR